jgi:hypothetical protein
MSNFTGTIKEGFEQLHGGPYPSPAMYYSFYAKEPKDMLVYKDSNEWPGEKKKPIPQHGSASNEHYTPEHIVEAARRTLGVIELDPASCDEANKVVQADEFFALPGDGLTRAWSGNVFLNPPGGKFGPEREERANSTRWATKSRAVAWWRKLVTNYQGGAVRSAVFVGFTLEILRTAQGESWASPLEFPLCVPVQRLRFSGAKHPTHGNVIVYLGSELDVFRHHFSSIGHVRC